MSIIVRRLCNPKRGLFASSFTQKRLKTRIGLGDPVEHATAIEKRELLAKLAGNENPFCMVVLKRGPGTKCEPNEIPSAFDRRLVGCICEEDATTVNYMWVVKDLPRRCECGHWFKLVPIAPL